MVHQTAAESGRDARWKQFIAAAATAAILGAAVFVFRGRAPDSGTAFQLARDLALSQDDRPSSVVSAMFDAARGGDVESYLNCFTGELREKIEAQLREAVSAERFAARLRAPLVRMKGCAILGANQREGGIVELVAEQVFDGYTESVRVEVARTDGSWKITSLTSTGRTANRYGQPAVAMPEEVNE